MNLFFFGTIKAEDFNATEAPIVEDDKKNIPDSTATHLNSDRKDQVTTHLSEVPNMSAIPKMPIPRNRKPTRTNVEIDETGSAMDITTQSEEGSLIKESPKIHDIPHVPESPNVAEAEKTETTAEHVTSSFSRDFKNFFEDGTSIEDPLPMARPYIIGGAIALPAFLMFRNVRRHGFVNYIQKSPIQGKLLQLLLMSSGVAAGTYFYKKPRKTRYVKDFRDA